MCFALLFVGFDDCVCDFVGCFCCWGIGCLMCFGLIDDCVLRFELLCCLWDVLVIVCVYLFSLGSRGYYCAFCWSFVVFVLVLIWVWVVDCDFECLGL